MQMWLKNLSKIAVISDLHMGANNGRSIFQAQAELTAFIRSLACMKKSVALVVLGDALDFLQVEPYLEFRGLTAKKKMEDIVQHNADVFSAFRELLSQGHQLIWCIGNHDVELVFPEVQSVLTQAVLPTQDAGAAARLTLRVDGESFDYPIPGSGIRFAHGNAGDDWNRIDYQEAIQKAAAGGDGFEYPPGSILVAKVLNPLRNQGFIHVDLLKPEVSVALPLTLALWPEESRTLLRTAFPTSFDVKVGNLKDRMFRFFSGKKPMLGGASPPGPKNPPSGSLANADPAMHALRMAFAPLVGSAGTDQLSKNLASLLGDDPRGAKAVSDVLSSVPMGTTPTLGISSWAKELVAQCLRSGAYNANHASGIFSLEQPDELDEYVRNAFTYGNPVPVVVIAGHTHLARAISYRGGYYINTGTWASLMRIPVYFEKEEFAEHASQLRDYFEHPDSAPWELRPFQRLTWAEIDLAATAGGQSFQVWLREWHPAPSRVLAGFP